MHSQGLPFFADREESSNSVSAGRRHRFHKQAQQKSIDCFLSQLAYLRILPHPHINMTSTSFIFSPLSFSIISRVPAPVKPKTAKIFFAFPYIFLMKMPIYKYKCEYTLRSGLSRFRLFYKYVFPICTFCRGNHKERDAHNERFHDFYRWRRGFTLTLRERSVTASPVLLLRGGHHIRRRTGSDQRGVL